MILFFDTSALVKFFHREEGTDVVVSLISGAQVILPKTTNLSIKNP
jgi:PIN domain nuclease of toxin-antitoxin system